MNIFVVIPAFNVEDYIGNVIDKLRAVGFSNLIVVDDNSNDNTFTIAEQKGVTVLHHLINRGQGAALQTGNEFALQAGADYIVHFDGDGQMRAEDIKPMLKLLQNDEVDVVLGSRYLGKKSNIPILKKYFYFPIGRIINLIFTGLWLTDIHCGFRAMNRQAVQSIIIRQDRMAHASEILESVNTNKLRFKEIPVSITYHHFGSGLLGINGALNIVKDLIKAKLLK